MRPFIHLEPQHVVIVPYQTLIEAGGSLRSIAVRFPGATDGQALVEDYLTRVAVTLFVGSPDGRVTALSSVGLTAVQGLGVLAIPALVAALIVLNAMMGAVYERLREIGIYSSVGLAPLHIALLFVAEACVYAVLGTTLGYLLGQGLGRVLLGLGLLQGSDLELLVAGGDWGRAGGDGGGVAIDDLSGAAGGAAGSAGCGAALASRAA